ncbi:hypothetical protein [Demequina litorisediminis]|uniref:hypothetical protein n=1 Tax=Demequina litorisediminis TaxID=1849022 RepID=UPI003D669DB3
MGGGVNKRFGLFDCAMVKDNHIVAAGSITGAVEAIGRRFPDVPVQVEVESEDQAREAVAAGARFLMLDNLAVDQAPWARRGHPRARGRGGPHPSRGDRRAHAGIRACRRRDGRGLHVGRGAHALEPHHRPGARPRLSPASAAGPRHRPAPRFPAFPLASPQFEPVPPRHAGFGWPMRWPTRRVGLRFGSK